jgi:hypothetical protein
MDQVTRHVRLRLGWPTDFEAYGLAADVDGGVVSTGASVAAAASYKALIKSPWHF